MLKGTWINNIRLLSITKEVPTFMIATLHSLRKMFSQQELYMTFFLKYHGPNKREVSQWLVENLFRLQLASSAGCSTQLARECALLLLGAWGQVSFCQSRGWVGPMMRVACCWCSWWGGEEGQRYLPGFPSRPPIPSVLHRQAVSRITSQHLSSNEMPPSALGYQMLTGRYDHRIASSVQSL